MLPRVVLKTMSEHRSNDRKQASELHRFLTSDGDIDQPRKRGLGLRNITLQVRLRLHDKSASGPIV